MTDRHANQSVAPPVKRHTLNAHWVAPQIGGLQGMVKKEHRHG